MLDVAGAVTLLASGQGGILADGDDKQHEAALWLQGRRRQPLPASDCTHDGDRQLEGANPEPVAV